MTQPLFSVVTPSYNQAPFLEETILSVLNQDYARLEYIIIDGGSTDGSVDIICRYENRLAYWGSERDAGQADAINKGWRRSTGDIVAYLNSDDAYAPGAAREAVEFFLAHPEVDVVYGDRIVMDERGRVKEIVSSREFSLDTQIAESLPQECVFIRRRALEQVGLLDTSYQLLMDYDLWLRMLGAGFRFAHVPRAWGKYRIHMHAKSSSQRVGLWREMIRVIENYLRVDSRVPTRLAHATRSHLYFQAGVELACGGAREEGARYLRQSFAYEVLPFDNILTLAARAANILIHALLLSGHEQPPDEIFDWLLAQIPPAPARQAIVGAIKTVRPRAMADYYLAKAFDDYDHGNFRAVGPHLLAGVRRHPAALKNRGVWSIGARSFINQHANR